MGYCLQVGWKWKRLVLIRVQVGVGEVMVGLQCREPGTPDALESAISAPASEKPVAGPKAPKYYVVDDDSDDDTHGACKPPDRVPCKYGRGCYRKDRPLHTTRYSHPSQARAGRARAPQSTPQGAAADGTPGSDRNHALQVDDSSDDECKILDEFTPKHSRCGASKKQPVILDTSSDENSS